MGHMKYSTHKVNSIPPKERELYGNRNTLCVPLTGFVRMGFFVFRLGERTEHAVPQNCKGLKYPEQRIFFAQEVWFSRERGLRLKQQNTKC